jgi:GNAT superfamily N-acetyltransferase
LRVVSAKDGFEQTFWKHADQDPLDYYFFILDLKERPEQTDILLALEGRNIEGLMLIYDNRIAQLRGDRKAVKSLLDFLDLKTVEMQIPLGCEDIALRKYKPQSIHELMLMSMRRGEEHMQIAHKQVRLGIDDAADVAEIMKKADPEWWGAVTPDGQKESIETGYWLGVKYDEKLVSVGSTRFVDFGSNIGVVATDERYRNMGFATSVVSALVQEIFKRSAIALIHAMKNNAPAVHVYSKVGFKPSKNYLLLRAERTKQ